MKRDCWADRRRKKEMEIQSDFVFDALMAAIIHKTSKLSIFNIHASPIMPWHQHSVRKTTIIMELNLTAILCRIIIIFF